MRRRATTFLLLPSSILLFEKAKPCIFSVLEHATCRRLIKPYEYEVVVGAFDDFEVHFQVQVFLVATVDISFLH